jgi:hypothetical protein
MTTVDQEFVEVDGGGMGSIGEHWGVLLFLGLTSLVVGIIALVWPGATIVVIAVLLAIWLIISGGMRALLFISGILSLILGLIAIGGMFRAVEILAIFIGIAFLFRGFGSLFLAGEQKEGRGWNIFGGIIMLIGGLVILVYPGISLVTLAWVTGIWLIVAGIFEIIAAFRLRSMHKAATA